MTDRELMQQALDALTYKKWWRVGLGEPKDPKLEAAITSLNERLAQPFAMQVRPAEFVQTIKSKETLTGIPSYWAEWPNREQP